MLISYPIATFQMFQRLLKFILQMGFLLKVTSYYRLKILSLPSIFREFNEFFETINNQFPHCEPILLIMVYLSFTFIKKFDSIYLSKWIYLLNFLSDIFQISSVSPFWRHRVFELAGTFLVLRCPIFTCFFIHVRSNFTEFGSILKSKITWFQMNSESFIP